jgi:site-specific recombinase XerD
MDPEHVATHGAGGDAVRVTSKPANAGKRYPAEPLTDDEFRALLDAIEGDGLLATRNRALLAVMWGSGLRVSEALDLEPRDVLEHARALRVRHGKGDKARVAALRPEAGAWLALWLATRAALGLPRGSTVFCTVSTGAARTRGHKLDPSYLRALLPQLAKRAGIEKRVHPHGLRHSHATALVRQGARLDAISGQLGHSSAATTDRYLQRMAPEARIDELQALFPASAWAERTLHDIESKLDAQERERGGGD